MDNSLSRRLENKGWVVYYRQGCFFCDKQKTELDFKFNKFIECDANGNLMAGYTMNPPLQCGSPLITGYPFWFNTRTSEMKPGYQDKESLSLMAL